MQTRRARISLRVTATLAIVTLLGTLWALRRPLEESWLLGRLDRGDAVARERAAARLGELASIRAIPLLFREFDKAIPWSAEPANFNRLIWVAEEFLSVPVLGELFGDQVTFRALTRIVEARGGQATPYLRAELKRPNLWACYLALRLIGSAGAPDPETLAAVRRTREHASPGIRLAAEQALARLAARGASDAAEAREPAGKTSVE